MWILLLSLEGVANRVNVQAVDYCYYIKCFCYKDCGDGRVVL